MRLWMRAAVQWRCRTQQSVTGLLSTLATLSARGHLCQLQAEPQIGKLDHAHQRQ